MENTPHPAISAERVNGYPSFSRGEGYALPVHLADRPIGPELHAVLGVLENLQLHPAGVRHPGLPGSVGPQFLVGDVHTLAAHMGNKTIKVFGLKADVIDLIGLGEAGFALAEHLDKSPASEIEIEADLVVPAHEHKFGRNAQHVTVEGLYGFKVTGKDTGMRHLFDEGFGQGFLLRNARTGQFALTC